MDGDRQRQTETGRETQRERRAKNGTNAQPTLPKAV